MMDTGEQFPPVLYPPAWLQFFAAVVGQDLQFPLCHLQMELQAHHAIMGDESLICTGGRRIEMNGLRRQRKGIAVPVQDGESGRQDGSKRLGQTAAAVDFIPAYFSFGIGIYRPAQRIGQQLSTETDSQNRFVPLDALTDELPFFDQPGMIGIIEDIHGTTHDYEHIKGGK